MKRLIFLCALFMALALAFALPSLAQGIPETEEILTCLREAYPQADPDSIARWGDTAAAAFEAEGKKLLCVLERENGGWRFAVRSDSALLPDKPLPDVLLDSDNALFWRYPGGITFSSLRGADGVWGPVAQLQQEETWDGGLMENTVVWSESSGGLLTHTREIRDENENLLYAPQTRTFPAPWIADCIRLETFDAARFPLFTTEEYDGQWPGRDFIRAGAEYLLPGYTFVGGALADGRLQFLADRPDGARVFAGVSCDNVGEIAVTESVPLPLGTTYGYENFTTSLAFPDGRCVTLGKYQENHPWWGVRYLLEGGNELRFGFHFVGDWSTEDLYIGYHPWADISGIDWETLPRTREEAVAALQTESWAVVANPDPDDRLNLRDAPDKGGASLGKYYNGTPVFVLEKQGDWAYVEIGHVQGWMMEEFLDFSPPLVSKRDAMPELQFKDGEAALYAYCDPASESRTMTSDYGMRVIGVVGNEWYHVWFPYENAYGFIAQDALWPGNG